MNVQHNERTCHERAYKVVVPTVAVAYGVDGSGRGSLLGGVLEEIGKGACIRNARYAVRDIRAHRREGRQEIPDDSDRRQDVDGAESQLSAAIGPVLVL